MKLSGLMTGVLALAGLTALTAGAGAASAASAAAAPAAPPYNCAPNGPAGDQTIYGTFGDASVIGWPGNAQAVTACLGGSFFVDTSPPGAGPGSGSTAAVTGTTDGYGVYNDSPTTWANADGYLPALVTTWVANGQVISLANFPTTAGHHLGLTVRTSGTAVTLTLTGQPPTGDVLFQLPAFVGNIASSSAGVVSESTGTVTLAPTVPIVTVQLKHAE
ncbi:MAG TPA: hypothetical protein VMI33_27285 [Streptosporangiaceae bacterium]|nr:hypothetical protein [Streptosporangiaceae bacterium]